MLFFLLGKRHPVLRAALGAAVLVVGLVIHSGVLMAVGGLLTVIGLGLVVTRGRSRGRRVSR